ncbi:hypothetical protein PR048_009677 [Dryococelus australis]|uniref:Uncharacterized protein n=1 Tax=Dryococelus australis TaxID=614101 RepID=A0ABQ9I1L6_9NEOP|nr:hypothetical protein PR048_009677 [Dryococelus australis]
MEELEQIMPPDEFEKCTRGGYFPIRRNHEFWVGTGSDYLTRLYAILKSQGGLTHGRGITVSTLAHYISSFPGCLKMCNIMVKFCEMRSQTTEQHVDLRDSRRTMDRRDLRMQDWLEMYTPLQHEHNLHSLSSGISADSRVNCDKAQVIGETAFQAIVGKTFAEAKISRKSIINSLSVMHNNVTINDKVVPDRENQLLMRIVCIIKSDTEKAEYFKKTDKSPFATLFKNVSPEEIVAVYSPTIVIDGYYLLHAATTTWPRLADYGVKTQEQARWAIGRSCPDIVFGEQTMVPTSQEDVLSNKNNKYHLIAMLKLRLVKAVVRVVQVKDDADVLIVTTALDIGLSENPAILVVRKKLLRNCMTLLQSKKILATQNNAYKLLQKNVSLRLEVVNIFNSPASHPEEVANTGERFVRALYPGGDKLDNIVDLRLHLCNHAVVTHALTASFELAVLLPTKAVLYLHFQSISSGGNLRSDWWRQRRRTDPALPSPSLHTFIGIVNREQKSKDERTEENWKN